MPHLDPSDFSCPLVVDLDGTLLKTDLLIESANYLLTSSPLNCFKLLLWLNKSKADLKTHLAEISLFDPSSLPYNKGLLARLNEQKALGRKLVLATASHKLLAEKVVAHVGLFDEILATEGTVNLKGTKKRDALIERFGEGGFDYIGNDQPDMPVWQSARKAYVVSSSPGLINAVKTLGNFEEALPPEQPPFVRSLLNALRLHQWIKNFLIFIPLLAAHRFMDGLSILNALFAFIIFGFTASSVYILNDLVDVADDRHHPRKRYRPFASGNLGLVAGWLLWPMLLALAFFFSAALMPKNFTVVLITYFILTLFYSVRLKQYAMLDVLTLAGLYTIRIIAGAVAILVPPSFWLLTFSMFIFLSLAFIKRFSELKAARNSGHEGNIRGRGYVHQDLELVSSMGAGAGYLSVLVLALYIHDAHTPELYSAPEVIWLACPILLFWISRAWLIAHRGLMHDDPIVFAIKDQVSWIVGGCFLGVFVLAKLL